MPVDWHRYPQQWGAFSAAIRFDRAHGRCECTGQCGLHQPRTNPRRCVEVHRQPAKWFHGRVTLTVAHLCDCDPPCLINEHVIACCQRCHLRIDAAMHAAHRLATQRANKHRDHLYFRPHGEPPHPGANPTKAGFRYDPHEAFPWHPSRKRALPLLERSAPPATREHHA